MRVERLGDSALILYDLPAPAHQIVRALEGAKFPSLQEAVASYDSVGLYFEPCEADLELVEAYLAPLESELQGLVNASTDPGEQQSTAVHTIPVCYELGEDLGFASEYLQLTSSALVAAHCSTTYQVFAIGFCPGFPYLGYLPEAISGVPRRSQPRVRVEPGSVAITGRQTGIYPSAVPGGWALIGRTPLEIVNVRDSYFPIAAGDQVKFERIDEADYSRLKGERL